MKFVCVCVCVSCCCVGVRASNLIKKSPVYNGKLILFLK